MGNEGTATEAAVDERTAGRIARAEHYLDQHLEDQRRWYDRKASLYKLWSQRLAITVLAAGALTIFVQMFPSEYLKEFWGKFWTCLLSLAVVLAKGSSGSGTSRRPGRATARRRSG
jgi:hypothetical protein